MFIRVYVAQERSKVDLIVSGSDVSNYIVEKRDAKIGNWTLVTSSATRPTCKCSGLISGNEYTFRVMAENRFGVSSPLLSDTVVAKYPFGKWAGAV